MLYCGRRHAESSLLKPTLTQIQLALQAGAPDRSAEGLARLAAKLPAFANRLQKARSAAEKKPPNRYEDHLQISCVKLLRSLPDTLIFSVPNHIGYGGKNSGARIGFMARQKAMGLLPGVSDLVVIFRNMHGATVFVLPELKVGENSMSENQQKFADQANALGCYTGVVRSLDDLTSLLRVAGHPSFQRV